MSFKSWLGSRWAEHARVFATGGFMLLTFVLVGACTVTTTGNGGGGTLVVNWTIASTQDAAQCAAYGAATISIELTDANGLHTTAKASCAAFSSTIDGVPAGDYTMTAQMLDASGAAVSTTIGPLSEVITEDVPATQTVDFPADSFGAVGTGDGVLTVNWTVASDSTLAACDSAGAVSVDLELFDASGAPVDTTTSEPPACSEFSSTLTGLAPGAYTLTATLIDASGRAVTTTVTVQVTVTDTGTLQAIDFPADSFVTPTGGGTGVGAIDVTWSIASNMKATSCSDHSADEISIQLYDANGAPLGDPTLEPCALFETALTDLPVGDYEISAEMVNNVGSVSTMIPPTPITVTDGETATQLFDFPTSSFTQ